MNVTNRAKSCLKLQYLIFAAGLSSCATPSGLLISVERTVQGDSATAHWTVVSQAASHRNIS